MTAATQARFMEMATKFQAAYANGDFQSGAKFAEEALRITPNNMSILPDYALCLMRINNYEHAYRVYMSILNAPASQRKLASATWLDGLTEFADGWKRTTKCANTDCAHCVHPTPSAAQSQARPFPITHRPHSTHPDPRKT